MMRRLNHGRRGLVHRLDVHHRLRQTHLVEGAAGDCHLAVFSGAGGEVNKARVAQQ